METKRQRLENPTGDSVPANDLSQIPTTVALEILSNGTTHLSPSVFIRTPFKTYLFNCPEGTSRFISSMRVRPSNIHDIFVTRPIWENIGGISGMLLAKEVTTGVPTRIHGPPGIKQYLEGMRPFLDSDTCHAKYPVTVEEMTPHSQQQQHYEDPALRVSYISMPSVARSCSPSTSSCGAALPDVAFLVELKTAPRRIDILKIIQLKVPNGPLIGRLKAGEVVVLPDGRTVRPDDVQADHVDSDERPVLLVVEVENERKLARLDSKLRHFKNGEKQLNYVVHFTADAVLRGETYANWMRSFGENCSHIIANGTGEHLPQGEGLYSQQILLNALDADTFPLLHPVDFRGVLVQDYENLSKMTEAKVLQRFLMRGRICESDSINIDLSVDEMSERLRDSANLAKRIQEFRDYNDEIAKLPVDKFPSVVFLGTSSAMPAKYRNVTGHLLRLAETSNILVDCGEGVYGQMRALFTPEGCEQILLNLHAVFITHSHQDHMNGLYMVVIQRREAFRVHGIEYRSLVVVCNKNIRRLMDLYSRGFEEISKFCTIVEVSALMRPPIPRENWVDKAHGDARLRETKNDRNFVDLAPYLPPALFDAAAWNLRSATVVLVHHMWMASGFIFEDASNGRKIVFSGDTKPCDLLTEKGRGADLLVHECTFEDGYEDDALRKRHCTMGQAIDVARQMGAKHVILSHFSARYTRSPPLPDYLLEAGNVAVAMDNMVARFDRLTLLPKLLPVFRELFAAELFELEMRQSQRNLRKTVVQQTPEKLLEE